MSPRLASPRLASLIVLAGTAVFACYEGNAPVRAGYGDLQFGTTTPLPSGGNAAVVRLDLFLTSPFYEWDFRGTQLTGNPIAGTTSGFDLTQATLDPNANPFNPLFVQYSNNHAFWRTLGTRRLISRQIATQHEVDLFARDPEEQYAAFATTVTSRSPESAAWVVAVDPNSGEVPASAVLDYPPQVDWQFAGASLGSQEQLATGGRVLTHTPLAPTDFWPSGITPAAPGSLPLANPPDPGFPVGAGSVKAARVVNHGLCSKFTPYVTGDPVNPGLFELVDPFFFQAFEQQVYEGQVCAQVRRHFVHYASFVHSPTVRDSEPSGGFFFYWAAHLEGVGFAGENVELARNDGFGWTLLDGRLSVSPERHFAEADGTGLLGVSGAPVETTLDQLMLTALAVPPPPGQITTLPEGIWQKASDIQAFPSRTSTGSKEVCTQPVPPPGNTSPIETVDATTSTCSATIQALRDALASATNFADPNSAVNALNGLPGAPGITADDVTALTRAVFAQDVDPVSGAHTWHNFRCHADLGETQTLCQFVLRAKRVNAYPDGVELVFVDDPYEFSNPTYGAWLAAWNGSTSADGRAALAQLCDSPQAQAIGAISNRTFSHLDVEAEHDFNCFCPTASVFPNGNPVFADCCSIDSPKCTLACDASQALCGSRCCDPGKACVDPASNKCSP